MSSAYDAMWEGLNLDLEAHEGLRGASVGLG